MDGLVLDAKVEKTLWKEGIDPFELPNQVVICSHEYAARRFGEISMVTWDLIVINEAHRLCNVWKNENGREAATKWRAWGAKQKVRKVSGAFRSRAGRDCYTDLYAKMLQVIPLPPAGSFVGDGATMTVLTENPTTDWVSSKANAPGVTTELMAQELPSAVALPNPGGFRTPAFHSFAAGAPSYTIELDPGFYAYAAPEVEVATGRTAGFTELSFGTLGFSVVQGGAGARVSGRSGRRRERRRSLSGRGEGGKARGRRPVEFGGGLRVSCTFRSVRPILPCCPSPTS